MSTRECSDMLLTTPRPEGQQQAILGLLGEPALVPLDGEVGVVHGKVREDPVGLPGGVTVAVTAAEVQESGLPHFSPVLGQWCMSSWFEIELDRRHGRDLP